MLVEDTMLDEAGLVIADREDLAEFQFGEDNEAEEDEDELDFAQGIDSEFDDDTETDDVDAPSSGHESIGGDFGEDEIDSESDGDGELDDEFDEY